ncbi:ParA family protein [Nostoc sp. FACHB-87]|uniref:ParA family protein n=1 Tax=Nostocaceae TaxID=1162 RepID=UPI001686EAEE|nr:MULTISPECIES: ParA family protein [Nostocaceae]MBD2458461.1 ParA family protein [Nostoc sp. FACHB-87]MBD2479569.1 ParA family protein [Anabaena sp. FACHB-83]
MIVISVFNFKGGTGKSSTTLNLGAFLASPKRKTLLIDLDGQRTLSFGLGMDGQQPTTLDWLTEGETVTPTETKIKHLYLIPGDIGMFRLTSSDNLFIPALSQLRGFDVVLMDCPPGLSVASVQAILSSSRILIPTMNEPASLKGLSEAVELIRGERADIPIDVVRTRYKPRLVLTKEADDLLIEAAVELGYRLLHTTIPDNIAVAESIAVQQPILTYAPKSSGARAYQSLAKECTKYWGTK